MINQETCEHKVDKGGYCPMCNQAWDNHLFQDEGGVFHSCDGDQLVPIDRSTYVVWTKCGRDVPANKSFRSKEYPTCAKCNE